MSFFLAQSTLGSFWSLVSSSGPVSQAILLLLLFFSILSWTIIVQKSRLYKEVRQQSDAFYERFRRASSLSTLYQECGRFPKSPLTGVFKRAYEELNQQMSPAAGTSPQATQKLKSVTSLERTLQKSALSEMTVLEQSLSWLATTGAVTPFIGLLGTVVGIINAFQGLGAGGVTTIQAVAPGISEALVATAAGLFAAIPAVIAYNHFINRLKIFGVEMDDFSAEFLNVIERSF